MSHSHICLIDTGQLKLPTLVLPTSLVASLITILGTHTITEKTQISYLGLGFQSKGNLSYSLTLVIAKSDQQDSLNMPLHLLAPPASTVSFLYTVSRYWCSTVSVHQEGRQLSSVISDKNTITTGRNKTKLRFWVQLLVTDWLT